MLRSPNEPREMIGAGPIRQFQYVPPSLITDAFNVLINDLNVSVSGGVPTYGMLPFASLPSVVPSIESAMVYVTNGRKIGESGGGGTGVWCYASLGAWRVFSSDQPVQA